MGANALRGDHFGASEDVEERRFQIRRQRLHVMSFASGSSMRQLTMVVMLPFDPQAFLKV